METKFEEVKIVPFPIIKKLSNTVYQVDMGFRKNVVIIVYTRSISGLIPGC